eukprot:6880180-Pyramimonas_sp.AAC.1
MTPLVLESLRRHGRLPPGTVVRTHPGRVLGAAASVSLCPSSSALLVARNPRLPALAPPASS